MAASSRAALPPGMRVVGDYEVPDHLLEDNQLQKRGYTTRAKEEARRTAVKFTGLVRRWEKRWVMQGHLRVLRWVRVQDPLGARAAARAASEGADRPADADRSRVPTPAAHAAAAAEEPGPARKRARQ